MHEYFYPVSQGIHKMRGGVEIETDQVDYRITTECCDRRAERPIALGSAAIERYMLHRLPFGRVMIWAACSAGNRDYLVPLVHQPRHEPGADMSGGSDDYRAQSIRCSATLPVEQENGRH